MNFPNKVYTIKYKERYIGFNNRERTPNSIILAFPNERLVHRVREKVAEIQGFPMVGMNNKANFILHTNVLDPRPNFDTETWSDSSLSIQENDSEEFILKMGLNSIHVAVLDP